MKMNIKQVSIIVGILLILAIPPIWPYGYYIFLRWVVFISAAILVYSYYDSKLTAWVLIFGSITLLFNPIIPIHLNKSSWVMIDLVTAILFFLAAFSIKKGGVNK